MNDLQPRKKFKWWYIPAALPVIILIFAISRIATGGSMLQAGTFTGASDAGAYDFLLAELSAVPADIGSHTVYYGTDKKEIIAVADTIDTNVLALNLPADQYLVVALDDAVNVYLKIPGAAIQCVLSGKEAENSWSKITDFAFELRKTLGEYGIIYNADISTSVVVLNDTRDDTAIIYATAFGECLYNGGAKK